MFVHYCTKQYFDVMHVCICYQRIGESIRCWISRISPLSSVEFFLMFYKHGDLFLLYFGYAYETRKEWCDMTDIKQIETSIRACIHQKNPPKANYPIDIYKNKVEISKFPKYKEEFDRTQREIRRSSRSNVFIASISSLCIYVLSHNTSRITKTNNFCLTFFILQWILETRLFLGLYLETHWILCGLLSCTTRLDAVRFTRTAKPEKSLVLADILGE